MSPSKPFSIISDRRQSVGVSEVAEQNRQRRHHLCCRARKRTLLRYLNLRGWSSLATLRSLVNIARHQISLCSPQASRFLLLVRLTHSGLVPAAITHLHAISKVLCRPPSGERRVAGLFGYPFFSHSKMYFAVRSCLLCTFFVFTDHVSSSPDPWAAANPGRSSASRERHDISVTVQILFSVYLCFLTIPQKLNPAALREPVM